ncbi:MAG: hypothetical protein ABEJ77_02130 [Halanaeroarchaeum sp.]
MTEYYDLVLGLIPLAFIGLGGGLHVAGFALTSALTVGGLIAIALVGHALFVNGPVDAPSSTRTPSRDAPNASLETAD